MIVWLRKRFGIQETGVWLSIDTFKLAITVVSGFCQGIAENQWDASRRLVNQFSALPMGWPFPVGCLSACHLSHLAFFLLVPWHHRQAKCSLLRGLSAAATYPRWHLPKVAPTQGGQAGFRMRHRMVALLASGTRRGNAPGRPGTPPLTSPGELWLWGGSLAKARVMHSAVTLFPICFFEVPEKQSITKMSSCEKKSQKPENSKLMLIL